MLLAKLFPDERDRKPRHDVFDSRPDRKAIFNAGLIPNIKDDPLNRKIPKRGRKRLFNPAMTFKVGSAGVACNGSRRHIMMPVGEVLDMVEHTAGPRSSHFDRVVS
jgi:hypothetical protein